MAIVSLQEAYDFLNISAEYFEITAGNDGVVFTSNVGGPVTIDITDGTYEGAALATALQTAMNANTTLTGTGHVTFTVAWSSTTRKFTISADATHTIKYTHAGSDAGSTLGFDADHAAALSIASDNACSNPTAIIETIRNAVEKWVQNVFCHRNFESQSYAEYYSGDGSKDIMLKNYPVTAITRISTNFIDAIQIYNTNTYSTATVAVTSTGIVLTLNGVADSTVLFAAYTTMAAVVTAINALGNGWYASIVSSDYDYYAATELMTMMGKSCIDSMSVYLRMPDCALTDYECDEDKGWLFFNSGFNEGFKNIRVDYTAGYSSSNMPDDLKMAIEITIKYIYQKRIEETFGLTGYSTEGISTSFEVSPLDVPKEALNVFGYYKRLRI